MSVFTVVRHLDTAALLRRAETWLLRAEAEHNLIIGLAYRLRGTEAGRSETSLFATVDRDGEVVGCAWRTPPHKLVLTDLPQGATEPLVDAVARLYYEIPSVLGPEPVARAFAAGWARRWGTPMQLGMRQRIYQLDKLTPPARPAPGAARIATTADTDLVEAWHVAFSRDAGTLAVEPRRWAEERIGWRAVVLWDHEGPKSMAVRVGQTPHGARIGAVYTPRQWRGRGYASSCVAAISRITLDSGLRFCFLYTDLSIPTSNGIYQRLGYRPVCDVVDYDFGPPD
jgi:predicted GNAT family acetyltransferase